MFRMVRTVSRHQRLGRIKHHLHEVVRKAAADHEVEAVVTGRQHRHGRLEVMALRTLADAEQTRMQIERTTAREYVTRTRAADFEHGVTAADIDGCCEIGRASCR